MKPPMTSFLMFVALALVPFGCSTVDSNDDVAPRDNVADFGDVVTVREGESVTLASYDATLRFVARKEDSRCPTGVVCVWEGQVKIDLELTRSGQEPVTFEIVGFVGPEGESGVSVEAEGFRFTLERLDPYPADGVEQTDPATATIRVEEIEE